MLLGPVAAQLGKKRLLIVADGMLHYIPFAALPAPETERQGDRETERKGRPRPAATSPRHPVVFTPLIVDHEIVHLPSASTLAALRRELAGRQPAPRALAVLADPVFTIDDERINPAARLAALQGAQADPLDESRARILSHTATIAPAAQFAQFAQSAQLGGSGRGDLPISRLPGTRQEAERIMALTPAGSGMSALDFDANRATATSGQLSQYRFIHFATHGLADSRRPELSTILLSRYDNQGSPQDGFLRAHEIYNLELPVELVTLSACQTGLGKLTRGEGMVSMTRGFMYAGAARVVVSSWSVSDLATAELMAKFYRRMLTGGERPASALRAAQVEMWRDKRWEAPYFWAAFTLQGEWR
jgi:CHAT domain-containing protein